MFFLRKSEGFPPHIPDFLGSNVVRLPNNLPGLFNILKKAEILRRDGPFLYKDIKIDGAPPKLLSKKEDWDRLYFVRLNKRKGLFLNCLSSFFTSSEKGQLFFWSEESLSFPHFVVS
jgi:hypothetical protein